MTEESGNQPNEVDRTIAAIEVASTLIALILVLGPVWIVVVGVAGWGFWTWAAGAAVWSVLLYGAVRMLQSQRCPRCGRPWRQPLIEVGGRQWPIQRRCSGCGFRLEEYWSTRLGLDRIDPRGRKAK
jgi:hypothetical protein